ncbi:hypothetical protein BJY21_003366 [Kineosphaera limosa]|nr:hypothetical protein [Kineosphaera limosa]
MSTGSAHGLSGRRQRPEESDRVLPPTDSGPIWPSMTVGEQIGGVS